MPRKGQRIASKVARPDADVEVEQDVGMALREAKRFGPGSERFTDGEEGSVRSFGLDAKKPSSSETYVLVEEDSDGSAVSISRSAARGLRSGSPVQKFGTIDSDDEVRVAVKDAPPRETQPAKTIAARGSVQVGLSAEKKRRIDTDVNTSPSKIRVQDLTLSPRKKVDSRVGEIADVGDGRRVSPRSKRPSQKVVSSERAGPRLLEELDAIVSDSEGSRVADDASDSSYRPSCRTPSRAKCPLSRKRARAERTPDRAAGEASDNVGKPLGVDDGGLQRTEKGDAVALKKSKMRGEETDVVMRSITPVYRGRAIKERAGAARVDFSDSDDSLPSPDTVFRSISDKLAERASRRSEVQPPAADSPVAVTVSRTDASASSRASPDWVGCRVEDGCDGHDLASELRASGSSDNTEKASSKRTVGRLGVEAVNRFTEAKPTSRTVEGAGVPKSVSAASKSVFSSAIPVPDDEDDGDEEDEEIVSQQAQASGESALLDPDRVHPDLAELYSSLRWINKLRRCSFIGYSNTEDAFEGFTPASYGGLLESTQPRVRSKLVRAMLFMEYKVFKSLSRVPMTGFTRSWECLRVPRSEGNRNVACVTTGVCLKSYVGQGREVGESWVKQLHVRPIENDWVVLQCNVGTYFNDLSMHAPGRNDALVFQTKRQGWSPRRSDQDKGSDKLASTPYSSPRKGAPEIPKDSPSSDDDSDVARVNVLEDGPPPYRLFHEGIPIYDGRTRPGVKGFRFEPADWEKYTDLPLYPFPEVEDRSLVTVVYTLTGFRIGKAVHHTIHFNALFAIVLGKVDA